MREKPAGAPPFKAHRAAYRELMENLYIATNTFQEEGDGGIEGAKLACRAVVRFVAVRHGNPELAAHFLATYKAFEDLEREIEPELFSKNKALRDRSRSSQRKHLQMLASVAMDVMMALGNPQHLAAGLVATHVANWHSAWDSHEEHNSQLARQLSRDGFSAEGAAAFRSPSSSDHVTAWACRRYPRAD